MFMALSLGAVSMIIVFISGMISGAVRLGILGLRTLIAFCVTSAFVYFALMLFKMYDENRRRKAEQTARELSADEMGENSAENANASTQGNFQPTNPGD